MQDNRVVFPNTPVRLTCPNCYVCVDTLVQYQNGTKAYLITLLLCLTGFWCCLPIPLFMQSCSDAYHYCPVCNYYLGAD